jgi:hypothetical protein
MHILEDLREDYRRNGIGNLLHDLLSRIVWSTVREYPASDYSPDRTWNQTACEDVLNDWIEGRLWGRSDLQRMLASAVTPQLLRAALTTSLRQHLTNKRKRSIASNLYKRIRTMLRDDPAFAVASTAKGGQQRWTLAGQSASVSVLALHQLVGIACELNDDILEVVRYGPFSQKLSPILRDPKLREFLVHLLGHAQGSLSLGTVIDVMRARFSLPTEEETTLDDSLPAAGLDPAATASANSGARSVVARLNLEGASILAAYFAAGGKFPEAARLCGHPVERIREAVHGAFELICDASNSVEEANAVMEAVESLLNEGGDK